jgi:hypothetical protein
VDRSRAGLVSLTGLVHRTTPPVPRGMKPAGPEPRRLSLLHGIDLIALIILVLLGG